MCHVGFPWLAFTSAGKPEQGKPEQGEPEQGEPDAEKESGFNSGDWSAHVST